jgi:hypothetical protein
MKLQPILDKLSEPGTWRGIVSLSALLGISLAPDMWEAITAIGIAVISFINIIKKG